LITGASRGIGRSIAERLAADGMRVVLCARSADALTALAASLSGSDHRAVPMDVGDPVSIEAALAAIGGHIDVLINNAGIAESKPYTRTDDDMWERMMRVNALGPMRLCRALMPAMVEAGWGRVVIVASNAGLTGYGYSSAYCASKHAVLGYMRAVALEVASTPVTINAVCPGWVDTDMANDAVARIAGKTGKSAAQARAALEKMSPQNRWVTPEEVAGVVSMLCTEQAASILGQSIAIDGGQVMR
jgi:NAD(P)-dependent dehydrogenase (short-subunit alcohol dehydrogenase family)